jgi:hypothetical protein
MVPATYHAFFSDCAEVAGSLIGLLFVAVSVSPEKLRGNDAAFQVKSGTAFATLTNGLIMSLVALLPGDNLALAGLILSIAGISSAIGLAVISYRHAGPRRRIGALLRVGGIFYLFVIQLVVSLYLNASPRRSGAVGTEAVVIVVSFSFAIERAWDLVGAGDAGMLSVFRKLLMERRSPNAPSPPPQAEAPSLDAPKAGPMPPPPENPRP